MAGMPDAAVIRDLMLYFLSDPVQSNLSYFHLTPLPHLRVRGLPLPITCCVVLAFPPAVQCRKNTARGATQCDTCDLCWRLHCAWANDGGPAYSKIGW